MKIRKKIKDEIINLKGTLLELKDKQIELNKIQEEIQNEIVKTEYTINILEKIKE